MSTILVVDDDPGVLTVFGTALRRHYPATIGMSKAEDAETELERMTEDERSETLVLMDVSLHPGDKWDDGCAAGRALSRAYPTVRFLFISGHTQADMTVRCPGLPPYVMKPITPDDLVEIVVVVLLTPPWKAPPEEPHRRGRDR